MTYFGFKFKSKIRDSYSNPRWAGRLGGTLVRYPAAGMAGPAPPEQAIDRHGRTADGLQVDQHIDNFSLCPVRAVIIVSLYMANPYRPRYTSSSPRCRRQPSADPRLGLLFFWLYLEDAPPELGPTRFWPTVGVGLGRIVALHHRSSTSYRIH